MIDEPTPTVPEPARPTLFERIAKVCYEADRARASMTLVTFILAAATAFYPRLIELVFGIDPDQQFTVLNGLRCCRAEKLHDLPTLSQRRRCASSGCPGYVPGL